MSGSAPTLLPEWTEQDAVLLSWPTRHMDWVDYLTDIHKAYEKVVLAILEFEDVVLITPSNSELAEDFLQKARVASHTLFRVEGIELNDTWIRDYGPLSLKSKEGDKIVSDFGFNGWGGKFEARLDNAFCRNFYEKGYLQKTVQYESHQDLIFEGGAIDGTSGGVALTTSSVLVYPGRGYSSATEVALQVKEVLGLEKLHILNLKPLEGDDTDGHVDTMTRYLSETVVVTCVDLSKEEREALETSGAEIHTLPMPDPVLWEGEKKPATYANFLIINGAIIVPTYGDPIHDQEAIKIISQLSNERKVVGVPAEQFVRQNGSIHCATMQIPKGFLDKTKLTKA